MKIQKSSEVLKEESIIVEDILLKNKYPMKLKEIMNCAGDQIQWRKNPTNQMKTYMHQNKNISKDGYGKYIHSDNEVMYGSMHDKIELKVFKEGKPENLFKSITGNEKVSSKKEHIEESPIIRENNYLIDNSNHIKKGNIIEGYVSGITDYGVFVENDIIGLNGLIHISNVKHESVSDLNRYFKVGDKIKATIVEIKSDNKVSLSTKYIPLNDYYSERPDYLNKELELLISYVKSSTGIISERSRNILEEAIDKHNLINVSLAVNKIYEEYTGDLSHKFMMDVLNELKVDYSVYDIEDHAIGKWNDRVNKSVTKSEIIGIVSKSQIILENSSYRYHKHDDLIFPCKKENGICIIKTVLNDYMYINEKK